MRLLLSGRRSRLGTPITCRQTRVRATIWPPAAAPERHVPARPSSQTRLSQLSSPSTSVFSIAAMSDQIKELADVPKDFIKDGTQFINR